MYHLEFPYSTLIWTRSNIDSVNFGKMMKYFLSSFFCPRVFSNSGLLGKKTRVLVTHRTNILGQSDFLMVLKDGVVTEFGPPNKLIGDDGSEISLYMEEIGSNVAINKEDEEETAKVKGQSSVKVSPGEQNEEMGERG